MNDWVQYKIKIRERLRLFVLKILELSKMLPASKRASVINCQITKSGTSMYANYRAALRGRSKASFPVNCQLPLKKVMKQKCG